MFCLHKSSGHTIRKERKVNSREKLFCLDVWPTRYIFLAKNIYMINILVCNKNNHGYIGRMESKEQGRLWLRKTFIKYEWIFSLLVVSQEISNDGGRKWFLDDHLFNFTLKEFYLANIFFFLAWRYSCLHLSSLTVKYP